jgi:hypothetical protein
MKADLPEPVDPTIDRVSPGRMVIRSNPSFSLHRFVPGKTVSSVKWSLRIVHFKGVLVHITNQL